MKEHLKKYSILYAILLGTVIALIVTIFLIILDIKNVVSIRYVPIIAIGAYGILLMILGIIKMGKTKK